ncbi:MAG: peptidylprolyl isomerase [Glaciihabitans sp.]|nr:peptidylprolyl isomerase [Glaciihabitans sp.]
MNSGRSKDGVVRRFAAIVVAAAFVVSLAACSDLPAQVQNCVPASTPGSASNAVTAGGTFGANPEASVPTPTKTTRVETTVLKTGKGLRLGPNDIAVGQVTIYTGADGKVGASTGTNGKYSATTAIELAVGDKSNPLGHYVSCQTVGTRSVTVMTAAQYFGSTAKATSQGADPMETLVIVTDVQRGYRGRATGILQPLQAGFPSIVTSGDGTPGVTLDLQSPPKTLSWEVVRRGSGAKVQAGDNVLLQVEGVEWTTPAPTTTFDSTWTTHTPRLYPLKSLAATADGSYSLDPGSVKALTGQTIGSQVLVVVPPKFGYPSGKAPSGYPTGSTLIFVYDILGVL